MSAPILDRERLYDNAAGDPDIVAEIVGIFLDDAPRSLADLASALAAADGARAERLAHRIKGGLRSLAADAAAAAAAAVEDRAGQGDVAGARAALAALEGEIARLEPVLRSMLPERSDTPA